MSNFIKIKDIDGLDVIININRISLIYRWSTSSDEVYRVEFSDYPNGHISISKETYEKLSEKLLNRKVNG